MKPRVKHLQYLHQVDHLFQSSHRPVAYLVFSRRAVHSSNAKHASATASQPTILSAPPTPDAQSHVARKQPSTGTESPLSVLPTSQILRTYLITRLSSSPALLNLSLSMLHRMLASHSLLTSLDRNPLLRWLLKRTFYAQFCAGENKQEVLSTVARVTNTGYSGVILEYALEVLKDGDKGPDSPITKREIEMWRKGMIESVEMTRKGDFVGLKWSGLGQHAFALLKANKPPTTAMLSAIHEVCELAAAKGVGLLPGAEEEVTNPGIDAWTLMLQERYNTSNGNTTTPKPIMYTTFQAYLRSTPANLSRHLASARANNHILGIKLVRGAYMSSEPASAIWPSKEETDRAYDELASALLKRQYGGILQPLHGSSSEFPEIDVVLATHNVASVRKATAVRQEQLERGEPRTNVVFAQLMGMADEVGCELLALGRSARAENEAAAQKAGEKEKEVMDVPRALKCCTWGTLSECLNFLVRRAAENRDAAGRTEESRRAMGREIWRRCRRTVGLS
ncbi:FAD-linked oxidoreductase [Rhizodiscina lignyota]|uniref:Proline dehydrogenase n=1 Tax=Rhizodiscina lignyota TaxID=1504668 RepID=A0A9P4I8D4_9PEZI|nr:FAD-linked oxidoreductase [Rhizodiscina lignyota]